MNTTTAKKRPVLMAGVAGAAILAAGLAIPVAAQANGTAAATESGTEASHSVFSVMGDDADAMNAETDSLAAALKAAGFDVEVTTSADGIRDVVVNGGEDVNEEAYLKAFDDWAASYFPAASAEEIADMNAEAEGLAKYLNERGIAVTTETTDGYVDVVLSDAQLADESVLDAIDAYYDGLA